MGIKMSVLMVTDEQIYNFIQYPQALETLLNETIPSLSEENCFLSDYWDALHYILTPEINQTELPLAALKKGDVYYSDGLSDPAHAIYTKTTKDLAEELKKLSRSELTERCNLGRTIKHHVYRNRYATGDEEELLDYFGTLRNFVNKAVIENKGLVFTCYEDW
jgi:Domain of unknown function (DUF1877)